MTISTFEIFYLNGKRLRSDLLLTDKELGRNGIVDIYAIALT